jgi:outer membrane receptor protein involved in Fe transport
VTRKIIVPLISILLLYSANYLAQSIDSTKVYQYNEIIIAADKFESPLKSSTSSISKFNSQLVKRLPINSSIELFKYVPGFNVTSSTGLFSSPILSIRGFNGGGEAEYLAVFIDNIQINDVETGLVDWTLMSNSFVNNIELVLGGSSSLYGDFAMGGVIDIQTFAADINKTNLSISSGSYNTFKINFHSSYYFSNNQFNLFGNFINSNGFRKHNKNKSFSIGGNYAYSFNNNSSFRISTINNFNAEEIPGVLPQNRQYDYSASLPFFNLDENDSDKIRFNIGYDYKLNSDSKFVFDINYVNKNSSEIRTFTNNTPIIDINTFQPIGIYDTTLYGDTKNTEIRADVINGKAHFSTNLSELKTKAIIGVDYLTSSYDNKTNDIFNGFEIDYSNLMDLKQNKIVEGSGSRNKFATFLNVKSEIFNGLYMNIGIRYDYLDDEYNGMIPDTSISIKNDAINPKFGLNYNYFTSRNYNGSIYGNVNKAFKAPTVKQLLDFNALNFGIFIPISQTDFAFQNIKATPFGNALLKPQESTNYEFGTYQELFLSENIQLDLSGAVYFSKIKNEIDFDLQTFKYENISDSKHMGVEIGIMSNIHGFNSFANYTFTEAESLEEEKQGLQLKGIPKNVYSFGFSYSFEFGLNASLAANSSQDGYLDDANENKIPDYTTWDGKLGYNYGLVSLNIYVKNLFNKKYYTMGYTLDNVNYYFPMAQRNILIDISAEL